MFCRSCSYPLTGITSQACPECGRVFDLADSTTFRNCPANLARTFFVVVRHTIALCLLGALAFVAFLAFQLDTFIGITASPLAIAVLLGIGIAFGIIAGALGRSHLYLVPAGLYLVFILVFIVLLRLKDVSPVEPSARAYNDIDMGMTEVEVQAVIDVTSRRTAGSSDRYRGSALPA